MRFEIELYKIRRQGASQRKLFNDSRKETGFQNSHENWTTGSTDRNQQVLDKLHESNSDEI